MRKIIFPHARFIFFLFLLTTSMLFVSGPAWARVYLELNSPTMRRIPIAVAPLQPLCNSSEDLKIATEGRKILIDDLEFSTFFKLLDDLSTYLEKPRRCCLAPGTFDFRNWSLIGAELLLKCGYSATGDRLVTEFRLYDTMAGKMIVGKRYRGRRRNLRLIFHKFANHVVKSVTGLDGEFTSKIAFCGRVPGQKSREIYTCDYDGKLRRQLSKNHSINISPAWSHDTNKLVFTSYRRNNPDLYLIDFLKARERRLTDRQGFNAAAAWSATDRLLALMQRYGSHSEITIIDALTGKTKLRLTNSPANQASPCWSPDNSEIAFVSDRGGTPQIYITAATGGTPWRRLTHNAPYNANPDWSNTNDTIVYASRIDGIFQICTIKPDHTQFRQLTFAPVNCEDPCWSPNGRHIIFTRKVKGVRQLITMDSRGRERRQLTFDKLDKSAPAWSNNR
jgi:TolB protein